MITNVWHSQIRINAKKGCERWDGFDQKVSPPYENLKWGTKRNEFSREFACVCGILHITHFSRAPF